MLLYFGQVDAVRPGLLGSWTAFTKRHCEARRGRFGGWECRGAARLDELAVALRPVLFLLCFLPHNELGAARRLSMTSWRSRCGRCYACYYEYDVNNDEKRDRVRKETELHRSRCGRSRCGRCCSRCCHNDVNNYEKRGQD